MWFALAAVLLGAAALTQVRITSFTPSGELTWTNSARYGAYSLQWAASPSATWQAFDTRTNLNSIWSRTNRVKPEVDPPSLLFKRLKCGCAQHRVDMLHPGRTAIEAVLDTHPSALDSRVVRMV